MVKLRAGLLVIGIIAGTGLAELSFSQTFGQAAPEAARQLPAYKEKDELLLPKDFHEWVYVGSPLTPNALNPPQANFPEYHNVYIEPGSYAMYKKTGVFLEGTIFLKELQLTRKGTAPDGSRQEPSGQGFFPGAFNGADVTVKESKRYAASGGGGYSTSTIMSRRL